ncbi:MAG: hypothetical protein H7Y00_14185, partial [Fimbriimonadaceae bacterium]|nr:hypothetical protein [Chitinophagales bacterium]
MRKQNNKYKQQPPVRKKQGTSPGTLVYTGKEKPERIIVTAIHYNEHVFEETEILKNQIKRHTATDKTITWINVEGLTDISIIEKTGSEFNLHNLLLEDVLNVYQIPKLDDYHESGILFITLNEFKLINNT